MGGGSIADYRRDASDYHQDATTERDDDHDARANDNPRGYSGYRIGGRG
jgi:hypothetical protein